MVIIIIIALSIVVVPFSVFEALEVKGYLSVCEKERGIKCTFVLKASTAAA